MKSSFFYAMNSNEPEILDWNAEINFMQAWCWQWKQEEMLQ